MTDEDKKSEVAENEEKVLKFWEKSQTFQKSENKNDSKEEFVFYDGPPFATGTPHFGHILAGTIKDAIPRYQTMRGKKVIRKWGWDCHGLPMENIIEKELGLENKKDIEDFGIEKFNKSASSEVLRLADYWEKVIPRVGRWVNMQDPYRTMDTTYTESVWWSFKEIYEKGLIYEGFKSMHYCPRCGTTLSNFEVNQGYKDIKDLSVIAKFELENEPNTFILAWTTTPWTLPGNMALAINREAIYCKLKIKPALPAGRNDKLKIFIVAKERLAEVFKDGEYEILKEFKGLELVGKKYKPVFDYYLNEDIKGKENAWQIYGADFVNMEEGTGIIHIAPAFGSDDLKLAQKENIPVVHHVDEEGKFKKEIKDFAGMEVKPKENHQATDVEIIRYLAKKNLLFSKEKIEHSYPHCWRCETPLLNYATFSWFLETTKIKDKIISENQKIKWVPENIGRGRMGKWLEGMVDWSISRSRYWGAPLPVWKCKECGEVKVVGSIDEVKKETKSSNQYYVIRHGEVENNILSVLSSREENEHHLTKKGEKQMRKASEELKPQNIDIIFSSPLLRTKESAKILTKELGVGEVFYDERLSETNFGEFRGKNVSKYKKFLDLKKRFIQAPRDGENLLAVKNRLMSFFYEIDKKYSNKNILIISHKTLCIFMSKGISGLKNSELIDLAEENSWFFKNAEIQKSNFEKVPHNRDYELDLHRPYIDEVKFKCNCGGEMEIIKEVFDCWYESGSMPYASKHYPFENLDIFNPKKGIGYPANFIAEGLDQTRGWFYSTLVLSVALFKKSAYQNVIVNGLVLAEDGQKMSKSKDNFPDPLEIVNKYGADALRYYMLASPLMKAEDLSFSEKGVDEILKKIILRFKNVFSFYELYKDSKTADLKPSKSSNILDKWILARLNDLIIQVSEKMDNYELDKATRPILDFIDDLSTWYLRRSRDRFKGDDEQDKNFAIVTTRFVIESLAKIFAPFMPFIAEDIWQKVTENNFANENKSVHLENWVKTGKINKKLLEKMEEVRKIVSLGLEVRAKKGIKVRQPLQKLKMKPALPAGRNDKLKMKDDLLELVRDELNVKEVILDKNIENEVELDLTITPELKEEGDFREFLRSVQIMRKNANLMPSDVINLSIETDEKGQKLIEKYSDDLKRVAGIKDIDFEETGGENIEINDLNFNIEIKK